MRKAASAESQAGAGTTTAEGRKPALCPNHRYRLATKRRRGDIVDEQGAREWLANPTEPRVILRIGRLRPRLQAELLYVIQAHLALGRGPLQVSVYRDLINKVILWNTAFLTHHERRQQAQSEQPFGPPLHHGSPWPGETPTMAPQLLARVAVRETIHGALGPAQMSSIINAMSRQWLNYGGAKTVFQIWRHILDTGHLTTIWNDVPRAFSYNPRIHKPPTHPGSFQGCVSGW